MAYQTLYRKWRPKTFDEVVGQMHITNTLKNEIVSGRISHAYIFTGTRGTGKTSTAKILSRALNCLSPKEGNPCNECDVCRGILNETVLDVVEMDAASNNGVDNIREIIDQVRYSTASSKYKVYIIDEVHMLSPGAFNALLKTLEEPPEHVIFILATTEIHKVLPTILSRCQRFDFKNITASDIASAIKRIFDFEGINADLDAIEYVAQLGNGSMRDALSIAEQCLAYKSNDLTYTDVTEILGTLDDTFLYNMASYIASGDTRNTLILYNKCMDDGKSPESFAEGMLSVMRELMVFKLAPESADFGTMKKNLLIKNSSLFSDEKIVRCIEVLSELIRDIRFVSSSKILVECTLVKLSSSGFDDSDKNILNRISELERKISAGISVKYEEVKRDDSAKDNFISEVQKTDNVHIDSLPAENDDFHNKLEKKPSGDFEDIILSWNEIKSRLQDSGRLRAFVSLFGVEPREEDGIIILGFTDRESMNIVSEQDSINAIEEIIYDMFSVKVTVKCVFNEENNHNAVQNNDIFKNIENLSGKFPENFKID